MIRLPFNGLAWNLSLALIPLVLAQAMQFKSVKGIRWLLGALWLLFLPNAAYMITDLIHLDEGNYFIEVLGLIAAIAVALFAMGRSLEIVLKHIKTNFPAWANAISLSIFILNGYGVYLGRALRLNSWEVFTCPDRVLDAVLANFGWPALWTTVLFAAITFELYELYLVIKPNIIRRVEHLERWGS